MSIIIGAVLTLASIFYVWLLIRYHLLKPAKFENNAMFDGPFGNTVERDKSTGLATYVKDSYGNESWYKYDRLGRLIEYKDSKGVHELYKYKGGVRLIAPFNSKKASL